MAELGGAARVNDRHSGPVASVPTAAAPKWTALAALLAMLASMAILSQFFRTSTAILGPELIRDLGLSSKEFGLANASFFLALFLAQIPVGMAFDRFGPRLTVAVLSVPTAAGAMLHGLADTGTQLAVARFITGVGCAAGFTASVVLVSSWFARPAWSMTLSWLIALSQMGVVLAGTPLAAATEVVGWRFAFVAMGLVAMLAGYLFLSVVHDRPPGSAAPVREPGDQIGALRGLGLVIMTPGLGRLLCMFMAAYAALITVQVLWTGPYLYDVHGLDTLQRGHVLLAMAVAQTLSTLLIGPLDRLLNTRKWVVVVAASLSLGSLLALATAPVSLPVAIGLLLLLCASSAYGSVLYAQIRGLFPDHLAGRGATVGNMAPLLGGVLLPTLTGFIPAMFPSQGPGYSLLAYRLIFATLALCLALGLAIYLTAKDVKPRAAEGPEPTSPAPEPGQSAG
jgi:MFS family permease